MLGTTLALFLMLALGAQPSYTLREGVVVAPDRARVFAMADPAGIVAIGTERGAIRWKTKAADVPILVHDGKLLAIANYGPGLRLVVLDAARGRVLRRLPTILLPPGFTVSVAPSWSHSFRFEARMEANRARIEWTASSGPGGGAHLTPKAWRASHHVAQGTVTVDLDRWRVLGSRAVDSATVRAPVARQLPAPFEDGEVTVSVERQERGAEEALVMHRSVGGHSLPDVALSLGAPRSTFVVVSANHGAIAAIRDVPSRSRHRPKYAVSIYAIHSGKRMARFVDPDGFTAFVLRRDRLLGVSGLPRVHLVVLRIPDGRPLASVPIRDLTMRGPPPP